MIVFFGDINLNGPSIFIAYYFLKAMSFVPLDHRAAGHDGTLQSLDGSLFIKGTTKQEIEFYNRTQNKKMELNDEIPYGNSLGDWMPEYVGTLYPGATDDLIRQGGDNIDELLLSKVEDTLEIEGCDKQYLILNNVLNGFSQPSIMDIKLGSILHDETASLDKVRRMQQVSRSSTSGSLKFRIAGMITKDDFDGELPDDLEGIKMSEVCDAKVQPGYITFNKYFGRKLREDTILEGLKIFFRFNRLPKSVQDIIISNFYTRLQMLYNCLLDEEIRVISGSLFFVFENDTKRWESKNYNDSVLLPPTTMEYEDEDEDEDEDGYDDGDNEDEDQDQDQNQEE